MGDSSQVGFTRASDGGLWRWRRRSRGLNTTALGADTHSNNKLDHTRDRCIALSAIGQCLKDQYDALATPTPPHLAALIKQLETH
jgi:hypothetical protein